MKYNVDIEYSETVEGIEAESEEQAIELAKKAIIKEHTALNYNSPVEDAMDFMSAHFCQSIDVSEVD